MLVYSSLRLEIEPVDPQAVAVSALPAPWPRLAAQGFHSDLLLRARGMHPWGQRYEGGKHAATVAEVLRLLGESFERRFDAGVFPVVSGDPHETLKRGAVAAMTELDSEFGDRVPALLWESLAYLGTRGDPTRMRSILVEKEALPAPYWLVDACLHAWPIVYGFADHVRSRFFAHTGMRLEHNCDCGCAIMPAGDDGVLRAFLPRQRWREATSALMSHLFDQIITIVVLKLPFELGVSPEAPEIMAYEGAPVPVSRAG